MDYRSGDPTALGGPTQLRRAIRQVRRRRKDLVKRLGRQASDRHVGVLTMDFDVLGPASRIDHAADIQSGQSPGTGLEVFHDSTQADVHWAKRTGHPFRLTAYDFDGSYLSLVASVPEHVSAGIASGHILDVRLDAKLSRPLAVFLRLNLSTPDGQETLHETLVLDRGECRVAFDLDAVLMPLDGRKTAWLDIIFPEPRMTEIALARLSLSIGPKGE